MSCHFCVLRVIIVVVPDYAATVAAADCNSCKLLRVADGLVLQRCVY